MPRIARLAAETTYLRGKMHARATKGREREPTGALRPPKRFPTGDDLNGDWNQLTPYPYLRKHGPVEFHAVLLFYNM